MGLYLKLQRGIAGSPAEKKKIQTSGWRRKVLKVYPFQFPNSNK